MYSIIPKQLGGFLVKFKLEGLPAIPLAGVFLGRVSHFIHTHLGSEGTTDLNGGLTVRNWASLAPSLSGFQGIRSFQICPPVTGVCSSPGQSQSPGEGRLLLTGEGRGSGVRPTNSMELGGQSKPPSPALYQDKASILASTSLSPEDFQGPSWELCHQRMCKELHKGNRSKNGASRSGTEGSVWQAANKWSHLKFLDYVQQ